MREVLLRGGPVDGKRVEIDGGMWIHVPVSPEPGINDVAVYSASGLYVRTDLDRARNFPKCPSCGGRTVRAGPNCSDADCDIVMCADGYGHDCVLAMHSKQ